MEHPFDQSGVSYVLDKSRLSIHLIAHYSKERRQKAREKGKDIGFGIISGGKNSR